MYFFFTFLVFIYIKYVTTRFLLRLKNTAKHYIVYLIENSVSYFSIKYYLFNNRKNILYKQSTNKQ